MPNNTPPTDTLNDALTAISRKVLLDMAKMDPAVHVRYSYMFCEVCEQQYRELLVRFDDGSVFTLCKGCVMDLRDVIEIFGLDCSITRF